MASPSFDEQVADMDSLMLSAEHGFGSSVVVEMQTGETRPITAVVDIETENAAVMGGSVKGVVGVADISVADALGIVKGDCLVFKGKRYSIKAHPREALGNLMRLDLGDHNASTAPDIRY